MPKIDLTLSQIENLMDFIEFQFIPSIRNDNEIDSMNYIVDMADIYKKLLEAKEKAMEDQR